MAEIFFVRHGQTSHTGKRISGYLPNVHLDQSGISQANTAAEYIRQFPIEAVFSSPLERAFETASIVAEKLNLRVTPLDFLKEIDFGSLQGLGKELESLPVWHDFHSKPSKTHFPEGESVSAAQKRMVSGLDYLVENFSENALIVCVAHCEIIRLAVAAALRIPLDYFMRISIFPASVSRLEWKIGQKKVICLNQVFYTR